jgi:uncharacterized damage-inducible protein DinB
MTTNGRRPGTGEYDEYFQRYIDLVTEDDIVAALDAQVHETSTLLGAINEEQAAHRYEAGKWSMKQVVGHIVDAERVFAYRALCIARGDRGSLPGFDEQSFGENGGFDARAMNDLADELATVRRSTVMMLRGLSDEAWARSGVANDTPISVRALAFIMLGHERHHLRVLRERYLGKPAITQRNA